MAILRRYEGNRQFVSTQRGVPHSYSNRYKRRAKAFTYTTIVTQSPTTLDYLSTLYYNTPLLYWAIADINDIIDPLITIPKGTELKIPQI